MAINKNRTDCRFYKIWADMKYRCNNPNCKAYDNYGGRGIKVCLSWDIYENFKKDMFEDYNKHVLEFGEKQTTLDRIDVNSNYEPSNCRWATCKEQRINVRDKAEYKAINIETNEEILFNNCKEFCNKNGFTRQRVVDCLNGKQNQHKGYRFIRLSEKER